MVEQIIDQSGLQAQLIDFNQAQMMDKGIDSAGDSLGEYSIISVEKYGKTPGHITLHDTGAFYNSMKVLTGSEGFVIFGDTIKDDKDISIQWPQALGLTQDSISEVLPEIKEGLREKIREQMYK